MKNKEKDIDILRRFSTSSSDKILLVNNFLMKMSKVTVYHLKTFHILAYNVAGKRINLLIQKEGRMLSEKSNRSPQISIRENLICEMHLFI